jgi:hypothetical protein
MSSIIVTCRYAEHNYVVQREKLANLGVEFEVC